RQRPADVDASPGDVQRLLEGQAGNRVGGCGVVEYCHVPRCGDGDIVGGTRRLAPAPVEPVAPEEVAGVAVPRDGREHHPLLEGLESNLEGPTSTPDG